MSSRIINLATNPSELVDSQKAAWLTALEAPQRARAGVYFDGATGRADIASTTAEAAPFLQVNNALTYTWVSNAQQQTYRQCVYAKHNNLTNSGSGVEIVYNANSTELGVIFRQEGVNNGHYGIKWGNAIDGDTHTFTVVIDYTGSDPIVLAYRDGVSLGSGTVYVSKTGTFNDTTAVFVRLGTSNPTEWLEGHLSNLTIHNFAIPATTTDGVKGVLERYIDGQWVLPDEQWGGLNLEADWSSGTDGWGNYAGGATTARSASYTDGSAVTKNDVLVSSGGETNNLAKIGTSRVAGQRYRITGWVQSDVAGAFRANAVDAWNSEVIVTADTWTRLDMDFVSITSGSWNFAFYQSGTAESVVRLSELKIEEVGCVLDLPMDEGIGYQLHDRSANHNDALLSETGFTHLVPKTEGYIRDFGVDAYNGGSGNTELVDGTRDVLPSQSYPFLAALKKINAASVTGTFTFSLSINGSSPTAIASGSGNLGPVADRYLNVFSLSQNSPSSVDGARSNFAITSTDADATDLDVRVDYKVIEQ